MRDYHELPKLSDSISYLYVEHCLVEQKAKAVEKIDIDGRTMIPAANLTVLMLGPGTNITHAAVKSLADNGCGIVWVGEEGTRFYAHGSGETRRAYHLLHQAYLASNPELRLAVCKRMYRRRFNEELGPELTIEQLRGKEGARVRTAYTKASYEHKVTWQGRSYDRSSWEKSDPINRALSAANALLYGVCHAAIVSGGYSPGLGFIHTGKQRSFVYDIADLYKVDLTIPVAFRVTGESEYNLSARVREACRESFREYRLMQCILPDIAQLLEISESTLEAGAAADADGARPEPLWNPDRQPTEEQIERAVPVNEVEILSEMDNSGEPIEQEKGKLASNNPEWILRRDRARKGLRKGWQVKQEAEHVWRVMTQSGPPGYSVRKEDDQWKCECPDYERSNLGACKHTIAVQLHQEREKP